MHGSLIIQYQIKIVLTHFETITANTNHEAIKKWYKTTNYDTLSSKKQQELHCFDGPFNYSLPFPFFQREAHSVGKPQDREE